MAANDGVTELLNWYASLLSRRVDLVGDYAGSELFVVEGDSLLLRSFSDPKLDFEEGFQLLHAIYAVEHLIKGLVQRNCNFHLVFFDDHEQLCIPDNTTAANRSKYLLARSVLLRHLRRYLPRSHPTIHVHTFNSAVSSDFREYLMLSGAYFMLCHDGASPISSSGASSEISDDIIQADIGNTSSNRVKKAFFRSLICLMIDRGYNVALINGLEWRDTKVMAWVVEHSGRARLTPEPNLNLRQPISERPHSPISGDNIMQFLEKIGFDASVVSSDDDDWDQLANEDNDETILTQRNTELISAPMSPSSNANSPLTTCTSEREYLTLVTLAQIMCSNQSNDRLIFAFLLHTALIEEIHLSHRPLLSNQKGKLKGSIEIAQFMAEFAEISHATLKQDFWSSAMDKKGVNCDVADLIDGRLFIAVSHGLVDCLKLKPKIDRLIHLLSLASGIHSEHREHELTARVGDMKLKQIRKPADDQISILPFSNPVFDKHLVSIKISADASIKFNSETARIFQEISHWHNARRRLNAKTIHPLSEKEKLRASRREQFFMAEMQAYAASLTNAAGKILEPEIVTLNHEKKAVQSHQRSQENGDKGGLKKLKGTKAASSGKGAGKKRILEDIAANKAIKDSENAEKQFSSWEIVQKSIDRESSLSAKYLKAKAYLRDLTDTKRVIVEAEIQYYLLTVLVDIYQALYRQRLSKADKEPTQPEKVNPKDVEYYGVAALIWESIRKLSATVGLTKTIAEQSKKILECLGLPLIEFPKPDIDRNPTFHLNLSSWNAKDLSVSLNPVDFQCLYCGPYMDRNLDSKPDPRVPFNPDGWQRQVLDELDADRSVFVVAPTSAGKTFISFYAMERVLKANNDSVLVYVAPTKALVNQIAAEVQARFKKTYRYPGKSVWAIHTRDYRVNNPTGCQILVTVPHILQIMLLSPSNARGWSTRVKTIIFDEIHSVGNAEDGVVWEQLLLLAPCPIIALSATVGNPEQFSSWLASTQKSAGHELTMIKHQHRYSDLRKFIFHPPKRFIFSGLPQKTSFATLGLDGMEHLSFIHPVASLVNKSRGIPEDLSLEARDCLSLWHAMIKFQTPEFPVNSALDPRLPAAKLLRKADVIEWETRLKDLLKTWMRDDASPFDDVVKYLGESMHDDAHPEDQISSYTAADPDLPEAVQVDKESLGDTTLPLICRLYERNSLPAIFFNFDRSQCEEICHKLINQLEIAEARWKANSPMWKKKLAGWEQWKLEQAKIAEKKSSKLTSKSKRKEDEEDLGSKADRAQDTASSEGSPFASFDPEAPLDGFHFAMKHKLDSSELSSYFWQLKKRNVPNWLMTGLSRGIGVHHAGMNRKYRQVVEMLFRKGYIRIVIATGTLALGINMPCATVVFSGDSVFLTALNFRQAAGRAGRRGFDLLGNVVFQNIDESKVCRLISSRLPDLNGHFPITTTLVLRLFTLLHESQNAQYAVSAINSLLSQPRLYLDGPDFKDQVLHHLRFSIEYLRRQSLLGSQGVPINLAGLTSHLYYTENSSFALNALLKGGYFHKICSAIHTRESGVLRNLMTVMAHIFGRRPCRQADQEFIDKIVKKSPSIVFLPPLPSPAAKILRQHNQDTLKVFTTYVKTFVDQHMENDDCTLPLTLTTFGAKTSCPDLFSAKLSAAKIRSAFVALSGHGDTFDSISDLCSTVRSGVFLEEAVIPHLTVYPEEATMPLNAYLYDFFMHGDMRALETANGIRKSDIWFVLNDFSMVLATITASLANFLKLQESDISLVDIMGEGDEQTNLEDDKIAAADPGGENSGISTPSTASDKRIPLPTASSSRSQHKTPLPESWDDEVVRDNPSNSENEEARRGSNESEDEDSEGDGHDRSVEEIEMGFKNIHRAFSKLQSEFNTKFKAIFA